MFSSALFLCRSWLPILSPKSTWLPETVLRISASVSQFSAYPPSCTFQTSQSLHEKNCTKHWSYHSELCSSPKFWSQVLAVYLAHSPKPSNRFKNKNKKLPSFSSYLQLKCWLKKKKKKKAILPLIETEISPVACFMICNIVGNYYLENRIRH